jgi:hypothetical protein
MHAVHVYGVARCIGEDLIEIDLRRRCRWAANVLRSGRATPKPMQSMMASAIESCFVSMTQPPFEGGKIGFTGWSGNSGIVLTHLPLRRKT